MAEVRPFRGIRYDNNKIDGDVASVVAPPYDVISEDMREDLYSRSPYNIIRLILGKEEEEGGGENKYRTAAGLFSEWQEKGVLKRDPEKSFYVYSQGYIHKGTPRKRAGFFGILKIDEDAAEVLPHEKTHSKPKEDRLNLLDAVKANLSPIFTLFHDDTGSANSVLNEIMVSAKPEIDIELAGIEHRLWAVSEPDVLEKLSAILSDKKLFIADGHHRYEVARTYRDKMRQQPGYNGEADHVMVYFADMADPENLTVMATHRVVREMPAGTRSLEEIKLKLDPYFLFNEQIDLKSLLASMEEDEETGKVFGILVEDAYLRLVPRDTDKLAQLISEDRTDDWKELDVSVLHSAIFDKILSVDGKEGNITYVKDASEAETLVKDGSHQAAFILNPTKVDQMKTVAEQAEMMPQKSTYFYPKLLTGLVINKLDIENGEV